MNLGTIAIAEPQCTGLSCNIHLQLKETKLFQGQRNIAHSTSNYLHKNEISHKILTVDYYCGYMGLNLYQRYVRPAPIIITSITFKEKLEDFNNHIEFLATE